MSATPVSGPVAVPVAPPLGAELRRRFDALREQYPAEMTPSLVLPLLHAVQQARGHVTAADAAQVAAYLGLPAAQVAEALSWYTMFQKAPTGRHVVKVCRNIACALRGSEDLIRHLEQTLGIAVGETTPDGRITLQAVECLASCGSAPAMQVGDTYHEGLDRAAVDRIVGALE